MNNHLDGAVVRAVREVDAVDGHDLVALQRGIEVSQIVRTHIFITTIHTEIKTSWSGESLECAVKL